MNPQFVQIKKPIQIELFFGSTKTFTFVEKVNQHQWILSSMDVNTLPTSKQEVNFCVNLEGTKIMGSAILENNCMTAESKSQKDVFFDFLHRIRKEQHITICAEEDVESTDRDNGFAEIELPIVALPELSWGEIDTSQVFMGQRFGLPILITGMTGGVVKAAEINRRLARAAVRFQIPMGVGSQRLAIENKSLSNIFQLKNEFPNLFLIANIGIGQICQDNYIEICKQAVDMIDANALAIHVNVLQELIQVEGDKDFRGMKRRIAEVAQSLKVPVLVKEVGVGLDAKTALELNANGIKFFDVGGKGGTSWAHIEGRRSSHPLVQRLGERFRNWGVKTAVSVQNLKKAGLMDSQLVATGGIRDGITVLKAIRCGATMAGIGLPLFRAALNHEDGPSQELEAIESELKIAMMCSGIKSFQ